MSGDLYQIETRRRSRSKTPFLRSSCDHENCEHAGEEGHVHHHKKKSSAAPNVHTIREHVEVSSSSVTSASMPVKMQGKNYFDLTIDEESKKRAQRSGTKQSTATQLITSGSGSETTKTTTTTTTLVTKSKKSGPSTSTPKQRDSAYASAFEAQRRYNETSQNVLNAAQEQKQKNTSASAGHKSTSRTFYSSFDGSNGDISDHIAYQEYKRAGDYWNKTPKTDYTYSELSPHRRELAPGIVAMPNMSRRSIENHDERVNFMIARNPANEDYIRRRYESKYTNQRRTAGTDKLIYESGDEVDITHFNSARRRRADYAATEASWYIRFITTIVTTVTSAWSSITGGAADQHEAYYRHTVYGEQQAKRGFFGSIAHGIAGGLLSVFRYIYMFISSVLCLDTILLKSSSADNQSKKRFLLFLLILFPLLLLAAWYLLDEGERLLYAQQMQTLLPISLLAGVRSSFYTAGASLRGLLQLPALTWRTESVLDEKEAVQKQLYNIEQNIQKSLTPEEYENMLNHVNSYVQQLVDLKVKEQQREQLKQSRYLTPEQTTIIVQLMRENLERVLVEQRATNAQKVIELSESDVQRIAAQLQFELKAHNLFSTPAQLTAEQLAEIKKLITQQIEVHNHEHYTLLVERIDLDALLGRILSAPQLADFVDGRINVAFSSRLAQMTEGSGQQTNAALEQQVRLIGDLNNEIAFIKLALSDKSSENADLQQSISQLKLTQEDLLARMQQHELATDKRFSGLLAEIESKLAALNDTQFALLNKQIKLTLVEILGFKQSPLAGNVKLDDIDLQNWVRSMFVAKEYLEQRLMELNKRTNNNIRDEIERSSILLMHDISERLKSEIMLVVEAKQNESADVLKTQIRSALSENEVRNIVKAVLAIYDADKTGLVDFALESAGGQILSTRCTESYQTKSAQISVFGIPLWYPTNTPRVAISPNVQPGECWAFQSFPGFLVLKLNTLVYVTGFTLEHIPKSLSPTGRIDSAPRTFTVWGLEHEKDQDPVQLGEYEYVDNDASMQYFPTQNKDITRPYQIVELRIESNHGQPTYTCLYRFRVHGKPTAT